MPAKPTIFGALFMASEDGGGGYGGLPLRQIPLKPLSLSKNFPRKVRKKPDAGGESGRPVLPSDRDRDRDRYRHGS